MSWHRDICIRLPRTTLPYSARPSAGMGAHSADRPAENAAIFYQEGMVLWDCVLPRSSRNNLKEGLYMCAAKPEFGEEG
jgi:hypothetical protein